MDGVRAGEAGDAVGRALLLKGVLDAASIQPCAAFPAAAPAPVVAVMPLVDGLAGAMLGSVFRRTMGDGAALAAIAVIAAIATLGALGERRGYMALGWRLPGLLAGGELPVPIPIAFVLVAVAGLAAPVNGLRLAGIASGRDLGK